VPSVKLRHAPFPLRTVPRGNARRYGERRSVTPS
jgi:hypothetical protein